MKNGTCIFLAAILFSLLIQSCEEKEPPAVATGEVSDITGSTAVCTGTVISEGSSALYTRGVCWSTDPEPTIDDDFTNNGTGLGEFTASLTKLEGSTKYYVRAYATNQDGTGYGEPAGFVTIPREINFNQELDYGRMSDQDGNLYRTIEIGQQTWMAENLRAAHFADGTEIPLVTELFYWTSQKSPAYCHYENDTIFRRIYGALYNWYAVADNRKICPDGWHVPSDAEFTALEAYLGGSDFAGMKIKEAGLAHWSSTNAGATNETGFTALPAGNRYWSSEYDFRDMKYNAMFWTATQPLPDGESAYFRYLSNTGVGISRNTWWKRSGFSVRCVKD